MPKKDPKTIPSIAADKQPLQLRIPVNIKRAFKAQAALQGIAANALFIEMWKYYDHADNVSKRERSKKI